MQQQCLSLWCEKPDNKLKQAHKTGLKIASYLRTWSNNHNLLQCQLKVQPKHRAVRKEREVSVAALPGAKNVPCWQYIVKLHYNAKQGRSHHRQLVLTNEYD